MKKITLALSAFSFVLASLSAQAKQPFHETFLPPNQLFLMDRIDGPSNVTQAQFNDICDRTINYFQTYANLHKGTLSVNKGWDDPTVNASAEQSGNSWVVNMYGGLARRPEVTPDGFGLVVCHELGHHFGGFAYYSDTEWAAAEGQADYFATHACARAIWADDTEENAKHRATVTAIAKTRCDANWKTEKEQNLCYRISEGGASLATLLAALGSRTPPSYDTPDTSTVSETYEGHPAAQCRMDTYLSGGLCKQTFDLRVIPGRGNADGQGSIAAEKDASQYTCFSSGGFTDGLRPACWFKARL